MVIFAIPACKGALDEPPSGNPGHDSQFQLTPSQEYAGELLSYLLKVVLGKAGNPATRKEWEQCGAHQGLDLAAIYRKMTDHKENISDVMVIDSNILDLSRVTYYYDHRLSLLKDPDSSSSIYPAPELLGIRLLLLGKIQKGEKINLSAFIQRQEKILHQSESLTSEDLHAMNLTADEMKMVLDILQQEPHFFLYLQCPFLVTALHDVGVVRSDDFTRSKIAEASYGNYPCRPFSGSNQPGAVNIAILPSITKEFYRRQDLGSAYPPYGFQPTPFFAEMAQRLKNGLLAQTKTLLHDEWQKRRSHSTPLEGEAWERFWQTVIQERISFSIQDQRPMVISPHNAERVTREVCPSADFAIILLGKNVYLSMDIRERDRYPSANRLYLDIMDIKHNQIQDQADQISRFIVSTLRERMKPL